MSVLVERCILDLAADLSRESNVAAVGLAKPTMPRDSQDGDIDVFVYCTDPMQEEGKAGIYARSQFSEEPDHVFESRNWGSGDRAEVMGIETWIMYFLTEEVEREVEEICQGKRVANENGYYPVGRLAMFQQMRILYERSGFLSTLKKRLSAYPENLRRSVVDSCKRGLCNEEDLVRAVCRADVLFYHVSIDQAMDRLLQLLFALNETYFPSRKRNEAFIEAFGVKPTDFYGRLMRVVELGAQKPTLQESFREFRSLREDTLRLVPASSVDAALP